MGLSTRGFGPNSKRRRPKKRRLRERAGAIDTWWNKSCVTSEIETVKPYLREGDAFLLGAEHSEPFTRLPPQRAPSPTTRRCHPSHNPYDPPFDAHGRCLALPHRLSPAQHPTAHHTTTNPPVFSTERRFVSILLCPGRPGLPTTNLPRLLLAPSTRPETPERRVGGDLVCGHVRNLCGGHGCGVL